MTVATTSTELCSASEMSARLPIAIPTTNLTVAVEKVPAKEGNHVSEELLVEGNAIKAWRVGANSGRLLRLPRRAQRKEGEVFGVFHKMILGLRRKALIYLGGAAPGQMVGIEGWVRTPQLDGNGHRLEIVRREKEDWKRIDNDGGFDARIVRDGFAGKLAVFELRAGAEARFFAARQALAEVRIAADDDEAGIAAHGEAVEANALGVDARGVRPPIKHEINQPLDIGRTFDQDAKTVDAAGLPSVVMGRADARDHKTGIGQRDRGVKMAAEPSGSAVRNDDERKLVTDQPAVFVAEIDDLRRLHARIPNRSRHRRTRWARGNLDEPHASGSRLGRGKEKEE